MGGDKVFLRCRNNEDFMQVFNEAIHFFGMLFYVVHRWMPSDAIYERGTWVSIYGTPIHVWNTNFFKLCVSQCGRFIKADDCTVDRGRIDYARILISTPSVEVLNKSMVMLIDGSQCSIKLVEEWGCHLGEDAFLTEEIVEHRVSNEVDGLEHEMVKDFHEVDNDVDAIIDDIHKEWKEHKAKVVSADYCLDRNGTGAVQAEGTVETDALKNTYMPSVSAPTVVPQKNSIQTATARYLLREVLCQHMSMLVLKKERINQLAISYILLAI